MKRGEQRQKSTRIEEADCTNLPTKFMNLIKNSELARGKHVSEEVTFVIQKHLTRSDVTDRKFTFQSNLIVKTFLSDEEELLLTTPKMLQQKKKGKKDTLQHISVTFVEPKCKISSLDLKKKSAKDYILCNGWKQIVEDERNRLRAGETVQLWAVRVGGNLWMVLVRLPDVEVEEGEIDYPDPELLPMKFLNLIKNSDLAIGEEVSEEGINLVIQKQLTESDVDLDHNQFTIPSNQIKNKKKFLSDQEEEHLRKLKKMGKI
ncbi:hypothetical protein ACH5RR_002579 [Cinchona calisaya]|uniref:TF-B3 domain-containing protein n=1 Tax=Cinchona calisaya TaxID=153742 RepID=A0ABD3ASH5_9GENT